MDHVPVALLAHTGSGLQLRIYTSCRRDAATICPASHMILTFDLLTLKVVSESRVTWATFVPILVFLGLSVLDLSPMYATDKQTDRLRQHHRLMPPRRRNNNARYLQ